LWKKPNWTLTLTINKFVEVNDCHGFKVQKKVHSPKSLHNSLLDVKFASLHWTRYKTEIRTKKIGYDFLLFAVLRLHTYALCATGAVDPDKALLRSLTDIR